MPRRNGRVDSFCDEQPRNGSGREMKLEELTSLLPPLWRFPHSGERIMKIFYLLYYRGVSGHTQKKNPTPKTQTEKTRQCSTMQLQGRCWREGRVSPSDGSGGEELNRMHIQSSWIIHEGVKGTKTPPLRPTVSVCAFPILFALLGMTPPSTEKSEMSFSMAPPYPNLLQRIDWHPCPWR